MNCPVRNSTAMLETLVPLIHIAWYQTIQIESPASSTPDVTSSQPNARRTIPRPPSRLPFACLLDISVVAIVKVYLHPAACRRTDRLARARPFH